MPDEIVTKSEFAYRLNLSPARVSQYVADGMPTRRDGKLYYRKCLEWVRQHYPLWRLNWYDRGAWRAQRILKAREAKRQRR